MKGFRSKPREMVFTQIDLKYATIELHDGAVPAEALEVKIGEGNLTFVERKNMEYVLDRGILDSVREGDQVPVDVTMDFVWEYLKGLTSTGATPTVEDALKNRGAASTWVSSDTADACNPYALDIQVYYAPVCSSGGGTVYDEQILLSDFRYEELNHDLRAGTVACTGKCNITEAASTRIIHS